jgi:hypothetical protein
LYIYKTQQPFVGKIPWLAREEHKDFWGEKHNKYRGKSIITFSWKNTTTITGKNTTIDGKNTTIGGKNTTMAEKHNYWRKNTKTIGGKNTIVDLAIGLTIDSGLL